MHERTNSGLSAMTMAFMIAAFGLAHAQSKVVGAALLLAAFAVMLWDLRRCSYDRIVSWIGLGAWSKRAPFWLVAALAGSAAAAIFYRQYLGQPWAPGSLRPFVLAALLIGLTEELIFRGYIFGAFSRAPALAIGLSAAAHTLYKTALFWSDPGFSLWQLSLLTLLFGLLLGLMRWDSRSLWPCILFHAVFDVWVYGDGAAPWWVWQ
jgi:membrane protease YdiL (CAAX protease family)